MPSLFSSEKSAKAPMADAETPITPTTPNDLPLPVLQSTNSISSRRKRKKSARFEALTVHWANMKRRIGTGTAPSSSSVGSTGDSHNTRRPNQDAIHEEDKEDVDEVVVDRAWSEEIKSSVTQSDHGASPEKSTSHQLVCAINVRNSVYVLISTLAWYEP
jgi:osomolarity two-component system, sensor histidine kinase SLN1